MASPAIVSHREKTRNLALLCKEAADFPDVRFQGYLAKYLAIMASAYIEISVKEVIGQFCEKRAHPLLQEFITTTISWENSLNCRKIEQILDKFDKGLWPKLLGTLSERETAAIDSLKALRDQIAHGNDNNTGYIVITRYFESITEFPEKLLTILEAN